MTSELERLRAAIEQVDAERRCCNCGEHAESWFAIVRRPDNTLYIADRIERGYDEVIGSLCPVCSTYRGIEEDEDD